MTMMKMPRRKRVELLLVQMLTQWQRQRAHGIRPRRLRPGPRALSRSQAARDFVEGGSMLKKVLVQPYPTPEGHGGRHPERQVESGVGG